MYNRIRAWWLKHRERQRALKELQRELEFLNSEVGRVVEEAETGQLCVEAVLKRGIDYYDPSKLDYAEQVAYKSRAEEALKNKTLQNEIRHLEADWVEFCAREAPDYEAVRDMRMCINALELIQDRLARIPDPRKEKDEFNSFEAV